MGIVSSSSDISIKASSTMPIEPQKTNSTSITSPSRSKQKAIVQPTGSPFILGIQAETASLNQPEVPTKGAVLQSTHPLPPRPSWAIQTRPEPDPMSPMTETVYTPNTPFNKGSSTTDDGSPPESAMSISSGTSPSRSSSIASSRRKRANYSMNCIKCREPAIPVLKVLIRCVECQFNYHTHCHNPVVALTNGRV